MKKLLILLAVSLLAPKLFAAAFSRISPTQGPICASSFPIQFTGTNILAGTYTVLVTDSQGNSTGPISPPIVDPNQRFVNALFPLNALSATGVGSASITTPANITYNFPFTINFCPVAPGVVVRLYGTATESPARTWQYVLSVINHGSVASSPTSVQVDGITAAPDVVLNPPSGAGSAVSPPPPAGQQGFSVNVGSLAVGTSQDFVFDLTPDFPAVGTTFSLGAHFTSVYSGSYSLPVNVVASYDPNSKSGPPGMDTNHTVLAGSQMDYQINFENDPAASAPAQRVVITDQLDPSKVDLTRFLFGPMTFGSQLVSPPFGVNPFSTTVLYDVNNTPGDPSDDVNIQIAGSLDLNQNSPTYGQITWTFQTLDPMTGQPPLDPTIGFLPPNTTPPIGQGTVAFSLPSLPTLMSGTLITNSATIIFDANSPILTLPWSNLITNSSTNFCCDDCAAPYPYAYTNTVLNGYNYFADIFCQGTNNSLQDILPNVPDGTELLLWDPAIQDFSTPQVFAGGFGWEDWFTGNPSTTTLSPGQGFVLINSSGQTFQLPIQGCLPCPQLPCAPTNAFSLIGRTGIGPARWTNLFSCPPPCGAEVLIWNGSGYNTNTFLNGSWRPAEPVIPPGQSALVGVVTNTNCSPCFTAVSIQCSNIVIRSCTNVPVHYTVSVTPSNCPNVRVVFSPPSGTVFAPGTTNIVHCVATNAVSAASCNFTVTVLCHSNELIITCPSNKTIQCGSCARGNGPAVLSVLHNFAGTTGSDGASPYGGLVRGKDGVFYGTTSTGGTGYGTVYKLTPDSASTTGYSITILHNFTDAGGDGYYPIADLIIGSDGALYGTTDQGGDNNYGTVFRLMPDNTSPTGYSTTTLHSFDGGNTDGGFLVGGLVIGPDGALYGTTEGGGISGFGTVYKLTPDNASPSGYSSTLLYQFSNQTITGTDGANPDCTLLMGSDGTLYGTTSGGFGNHPGTVFKLIPDNGSPTGYTISYLHLFELWEGFHPYAGLVMGTDGSLFGTTLGSATAGAPPTVFQLKPDNNSPSGYSLITLYSFPNGPYGELAQPYGGLVIGSDGTLYGTTVQGGYSAGDVGIVFKLTPDISSPNGYSFAALHTFNYLNGESVEPYAGLLLGSDGSLFGTTFLGGSSGAEGTVFKLGCAAGWSFDPPTAVSSCCASNVALTVLSTVTNGTCPQLLTRTWLATDCCGNTATCSQTVTIVDTNPPVITCSSNKTVLPTAAWTFDPPSAWDDCSGSNVTIAIVSTVTNGPCPQLITRTWQATDSCGNTATCSQTVTVTGSGGPLNVTCPSNIVTSTFGPLPCGAPVDYQYTPPHVSGGCSTNITLTCLPPPGYFFSVGTTTVNCVASNDVGQTASCSFTITVHDTTPPVLNCASNKTVSATAGWTFDPPSAWDDCSGSNVTIAILSTATNGSCPQFITRTWRATDLSGNSSTCSQTVTVIGAGAPLSVTCPSNIVTSTFGPLPCGAPVDYQYNPPHVSGGCSTNFNLTCLPPPGSFFPVGNTTVNCVATNNVGQIAQCSFTVTVRDTQSPVLICDTSALVFPLDGACQLHIPQLYVRATDNCTPSSQIVITQSPPAGAIVPGPSEVVTITARDAAGNTAVCQRTVVGVDRTPPHLVVPPVITVSNCVVPNVLTNITASDNCTPVNQLIITQSPAAGGPIGPGLTSITVTVKDQAGNQTSRTIQLNIIASVNGPVPLALWNTGLDNNGQLLPDGAVDSHYPLIGAPPGSGANSVATTSPWFVQPPSSKWIRMPNDYSPPGYYTNRVTFTLGGGTDPSSAYISGRWAADNSADMYLNGHLKNSIIGQYGFQSFTSFSLSGDFVSGPNTLDFVVYNYGHYTGLRVEMSGTVNQCLPCYPPHIRWMDGNQTRTKGSTAVFDIAVSGSPTLTYQWYHNGQPLTDGFYYWGSHSRTLTIRHLDYAQAGSYYVVISNACGTVTSQRSTLTVRHGWPWPFGSWTFSQPGNPLGANFGPDLVLSGTNSEGMAFGSSEDFGLPNPAGQPANVMFIGNLPEDTTIQLPAIAAGVSNLQSYSLVADIYSPSSSSGTVRTLFESNRRSPGLACIVDAQDHLSILGTGDTILLLSASAIPLDGWNRIAMILDDPNDGPYVTASLYLNGLLVGMTNLDRSIQGLALDWTSNSPPTLFSSAAGQSGQLYVAGVQFHASALNSQQLASLGGPETGPMPEGDLAIGNQPVLSMTSGNGAINLSWTGDAFALQESSDLSSALWSDSTVPFDQAETNGDISTTAHPNPAAGGPTKFYRLVFRP